MKESTFRSAILKELNRKGLDARCTEVPTDPGWPDITVLTNDEPIFIECKVYKSPFFWKHFQPSQINWYRDHFKHGRENLWAAIYKDRGEMYMIEITYDLFRQPEACITEFKSYKNYGDLYECIKLI